MCDTESLSRDMEESQMSFLASQIILKGSETKNADNNGQES